MTTRRTGVVMAIAVLAVSGAVGCSGSGSSGAAGSGGSGAAGGSSHVAGDAVARKAVAGLSAADTLYGAATLQPAGTATPPAQESALPPAQPSNVIKTAQLSLDVKRGGFTDAIDQAGQIAGDAGGYVISTERSGGRNPGAVIVLRVPAARFTAALAKMHGLAGAKVRAESVNGQEVGQEFVDLGARERNLNAQEAVLLRLMNRAISVSDTIRVEDQLSQVQGQIEQIAGRLRYLHNQANLSTITLTLRQPGPPAAAPGKPGALHSAFSRAWSGCVSVISGVIVGAGVVLPIALLLAIAAAAGLRLWPPLRRRLEPPAATAPASE